MWTSRSSTPVCRPGEKLYEELLMKEEGMQETANKLIHIGKPIEMDDALLEQQLKRLDEASRAESEDIKDIVAEIRAYLQTRM